LCVCACSQRYSLHLFGSNFLSAMGVSFYRGAMHFRSPRAPCLLLRIMSTTLHLLDFLCATGGRQLDHVAVAIACHLHCLDWPAGSGTVVRLGQCESASQAHACLPHHCLTHTHARANGSHFWMCARVSSPIVSRSFIGSCVSTRRIFAAVMGGCLASHQTRNPYKIPCPCSRCCA
jgi:hypothetical protein